MASSSSSSTVAIAALALITLTVASTGAWAYPRLCRDARQRAEAWQTDLDDDSLDARCRYGWEVDVCGVRRCAAGPGQLCGGKHQRYGICGEGLMCSPCNRCYGCSLKTFECFEDRGCNNFFLK